jgi:type II secretory pathway component PulF
VRERLKGGNSFADALAGEAGLFSDFYVQMVRPARRRNCCRP